ncbi:MAG: 23S rRNA (uracil(1939)-C(5))-methyltransferase RlmD [Tepidanaerobacteraceae bacterium]|nr:23S rRNA (uracil(1939)-C(5))-methyltransferase RlmD [Tepidanaerobacteraceae bacterium]
MDQHSKIKLGQQIDIDIDSMAHEGQGVGRVNGMAVFVEGALKGEKVRARVEKAAKNYAIAHVEDILIPSPDRIKPVCPYFYRCGGCTLQHLSYRGQLEFKTQRVKECLEKIGRINTIVHNTIGMSDPWRYRNKAQYPIGRDGSRTVLGFYEKRTHNIVPSDSCLIQHDISNEVSRVIREWADRFNVSIYDEKKHTGLLRHVITKIGFKTGEVMVILVVNGNEIPRAEELIEILRKKIRGFKSLILNNNDKKTNVILGNKNTVIFGPPYIHDYIGEIKFSLSPVSFFQVNPMQVEILYGKVLEYARLTGRETVIDAYCGIGTITLFLARRAKKVCGIEIVAQAVQDARHNAGINGINNVEFIEGAAEDVMQELVKKGDMADVVVMDPPRRGCDEKLLQAAADMEPQSIVYVSCNPATLARDLRFLEDRGYRTQEAQPVDMFPHTAHVECVVLMSNVKNE